MYQVGKRGAEWTEQRPVPEHRRPISYNSSNCSLQSTAPGPQLAKGYSPPLLKWARSTVKKTVLGHRTLPCPLRGCRATRSRKQPPDQSAILKSPWLGDRWVMICPLGLQITLPFRLSARQEERNEISFMSGAS